MAVNSKLLEAIRKLNVDLLESIEKLGNELKETKTNIGGRIEKQECKLNTHEKNIIEHSQEIRILREK